MFRFKTYIQLQMYHQMEQSLLEDCIQKVFF